MKVFKTLLTAVLIGTLKVQVSRPCQLVVVIQNCGMGYAGIEPYIHDVIFLGELLAAALALGIRRDQLGNVLCPPCVGALLAEHVSDAASVTIGLWQSLQ